MDSAARAQGLRVSGALHEDREEQTAGTTLALLSPDEPRFWDRFTQAPEYSDAQPDPMDRWSRRVISRLAHDWQANALFPSDGPPYPPFISWALASGRHWVSPAGLLVQDHAGLFASFRGALRLPGTLDLLLAPENPCIQCDNQPCTTACPVAALRPEGYDVHACRTHIAGHDSARCASRGCAARRACPVSQQAGRNFAQSAFHMRAFLQGD